MTTHDAAILQPVLIQNRITSLDVARGFALLGILMVNVQLLCQPIGWLFDGGGSNEGPVGTVAYYATRVLFESKSYPLFSLLFGMGLMLMRERAIAAGRGFARTYLRRLSMLLVMGVVHALLLYHADVLVIYSIIGFITMWLMGRRAKVLLRFALALLTLAVLFSVLSGFMGMRYHASKGADSIADEPAQTGVLEPSGDGTPFVAFFERFKEGDIPVEGPLSPEWESAARDAYQHGPLSHAVQMRMVEWIAEQVGWTLGSGAVLQISGMFFLGAWLMRIDALGAGAARSMRRMVLIGCLVGMPCSIIAVILMAVAPRFSALFFLSTSFMTLAAPCVALGYMGLSMWVARRFGGSLLARSVASTGRMALTNYLMQSLLVCVIAQHWGFGMYSEISQAQMLAIAVSIYSFQLIVSPLWLSRFTMGPLEWLWRWWTYLRRPKLLKG